MTSLFFDTNALIYWINARDERHDEVDRLIGRAIEHGVALHTGACQLNEVYYVTSRHHFGESVARALLADIAEVFSLVSLDEGIVRDALGSDEPDYEDGLVRAMAEHLAVDALVSYDERAFKRSPIPKVTAREALELEGLADGT